mmetsp:Transcript_14242/g.30339  ORF Transcript_14242/g.30339 Transcript_14242/m.30339 type:complete len:219 (+) Transcript_14242:471-1127(+)
MNLTLHKRTLHHKLHPIPIRQQILPLPRQMLPEHEIQKPFHLRGGVFDPLVQRHGEQSKFVIVLPMSILGLDEFQLSYPAEHEQIVRHERQAVEFIGRGHAQSLGGVQRPQMFVEGGIGQVRSGPIKRMAIVPYVLEIVRRHDRAGDLIGHRHRHDGIRPVILPQRRARMLVMHERLGRGILPMISIIAHGHGERIADQVHDAHAQFLAPFGIWIVHQ